MPTNKPTKRQPYLGRAFYAERIAQIQRYLASQDLEGLLLLSAPNINWATGFFHSPSERALSFYIPAQGDCTFYVPFLEAEHVAGNGMGEVRWYWEYPGEVPAEIWMMQQIPAQRLAIDGTSAAMFPRLQAVKPLLRLDSQVNIMRHIKSEPELQVTEWAAGYADFAVSVARRAVAEQHRSGITEIEVVQIVKTETMAKIREEVEDMPNSYPGGVGLTVHAGPRGAFPHGQPGMTRIRPGDTLIVGVGAQVGGYHAESAATFVVGQPTPDQLHCLQAAWDCDQAAVDALRPGVPCEAVDEAALAVLRDAGLGDAIRHRIGHGIGVQAHEAPWLSTGDKTLAQPGMVFSNEPGIYRPGVDGYRTISTMIVTPKGSRRLSRYLSQHGPDDRVIPA
ncbi:MAG: aminopeptidase P family protein [Chloroflexi bacterium]|nr:aminopeptidase P family protein [Chloroflexota bacterium]